MLLDLPDFDSREIGNRTEAERVLELVDLFVWVTDPQKYADARLHDDYVAALATHEAVTMVVLNQADRLTDAEVAQCRADLVRLMERDGVPRATVLATSVTTGDGLDELHQRLANAVAGRTMSRARLAGDVRAAAGALTAHVAEGEPAVDAAARAELLDALARSAGVPTVVEAVERDYRMEAAASTGWPFTRWVQRLRPRPLRRLRLDGRDIRVTDADVRSVLGRSSLPPPSPAARAAVDLATRRLADRASAALPHPWADAVERAADPPGPALGDALDRAVVGTSLLARVPIWWRVVGLVQLVLAVAAVVGFLWLALYVVVGWAQLDQVIGDPPTLGVVPVPLVLFVLGLLGGLLLALVSRWLARVGARRRGRVMDGRLRASIDGVAQAEIVQPVERVLERHAATRVALQPRRRRLSDAGRRPQARSCGRRVVHRVAARRCRAPARAPRLGAAAPRDEAGGGRTMNETYVTIRGRLTADPSARTTRTGRADDEVPPGHLGPPPGAGPAGPVGGHRDELLRRAVLPLARRQHRRVAPPGPPGHRARQAAHRVVAARGRHHLVRRRDRGGCRGPRPHLRHHRVRPGRHGTTRRAALGAARRRPARRPGA